MNNKQTIIEIDKDTLEGIIKLLESGSSQVVIGTTLRGLESKNLYLNIAYDVFNRILIILKSLLRESLEIESKKEEDYEKV